MIFRMLFGNWDVDLIPLIAACLPNVAIPYGIKGHKGVHVSICFDYCVHVCGVASVLCHFIMIIPSGNHMHVMNILFIIG